MSRVRKPRHWAGAVESTDGLTSHLLHRRLWADDVRNDAFMAALQARVPRDGSVIDLGAGTGLLGLLACRAGAGRVVAIEQGDFEALAKELFAENGFAERLSWVACHSIDVELTEAADVIVAELFGAAGVEEGILTYLADARDRFLAPGGYLIPERLRVIAAPVNASASRIDGVRCALEQRLQPDHLLGPPVVVASFNLYQVGVGTELAAQERMPIDKDGALEGVAMWFEAGLAPGVVLSTSPFALETHWKQLLLPASRVEKVCPGDVVPFAVRSTNLDAGTRWRWRIGSETEAGGPAVQVSRRVRLTETGALDLELLELLADGWPPAEVASHLRSRHGSRFPSGEAALRRVKVALYRSLGARTDGL